MLRTLFGLHGRVNRRVYLVTGISLMLLKYVVDATAIYLVAHIVWTPRDYLIPLFSIKSAKVTALPSWLGFALVLWALPFIWIGVTMMMRGLEIALSSASARPSMTMVNDLPEP